jgi:hypothetical protein
MPKRTSESLQEQKERIAKRDALIVKHYMKLREKKYNNKTQYYHDSTILEMVGDKSFLSASYVDSIVSGHVKR